MAISDTSFFNNYQQTLGLTYAKCFNSINNPVDVLANEISARQSFLASMSSTDVTNGLTVVNAQLQSETTYSSAASGIVKNTISTLNNFFFNTYGGYLRDTFSSLSTTKLISWKNSFKESYYQSVKNELVQQIGFCTWTGSQFVIYPANASITNIQNVLGVFSTSGDYVTVSTSIASPITNFALPGDIIVASGFSTLPAASTISFGTTLIGYAATNIILLSGPISGSITNLFAFRPLKNPEYLEFRFGTASVTGSGFCATSVASDFTLSITLNGGIGTVVDISPLNSSGRVTIGIYNNTQYQTTGISAVTLNSGTAAALLGTPAIEIWVKSVN